MRAAENLGRFTRIAAAVLLPHTVVTDGDSPRMKQARVSGGIRPQTS